MKKEAARARERARDEKVLNEVRSDGAPLSSVARDAIAEIRVRSRAAKEASASVNPRNKK